MPLPSIWTPERVKVLEDLWNRGFSATEISNRMQLGLSRNSVIGKIHRLKMPKREKPHVEPKPSKPPKARKASKQVTLPPLPINGPVLTADTKELRSPAWEPLLMSVPKRMADLGDLGRHDKLGECRWPVGDAPMLFCACAAYGVYCPTHAVMARPRVAA